jgi:hypothetical protein
MVPVLVIRLPRNKQSLKEEGLNEQVMICNDLFCESIVYPHDLQVMISIRS